MSGGGHGHGGAHGHDAHHDEAAYDAFKVKFDKVYDEHRKSAQQIKFAHSRAHEAAEDAIGKDYQGLVAEGEAGDKLRDTYKTTLRSTLKKEIAQRFEVYGLRFDPEADNPIADKFYEGLGVPKMEDLDKLIDTLDEYNPADIEAELDNYQRAFIQEHMGNLPDRYARKASDRAHLIRRLGLEEDVDSQYVEAGHLRQIMARHALQGKVPRAALPKEVRKKKGAGSAHH